MSDLVEFLRARLDEDEARWKHGGEHTYGHTDACSWWGDMPGYCDCNGHDRVLREVEAKRRIVHELTTERHLRKATDRRGVYESVVEAELLDSWEAELTVKALAAIYSDHPDYRDEWKP